MYDFKSVTDLVKCLTKSSSVVGSIHLNEAEKGVVRLPDPWRLFFNPMPCHSKIGVRIRCLPCIAGDTDFTRDEFGLQ